MSSQQGFALDPVSQRLLFHDARTANTFKDEPVTSADVRAMYDLVKWAPTSMNTQPLRIAIVASVAARERLVPLMSPGNQQKTATAPMTVILAADTEFHEHLPTVFPHAKDAKNNFADPAQRESFALSQAWLQAGYFILGVRAAGLAAGPMAGFDRSAVDAEFFAELPWKSFCVVNIGKPGPDAWFERNPRHDHDVAILEL
jgi:3-hydroxypropanoate dehydrogenase